MKVVHVTFHFLTQTIQRPTHRRPYNVKRRILSIESFHEYDKSLMSQSYLPHGYRRPRVLRPSPHFTVWAKLWITPSSLR